MRILSRLLLLGCVLPFVALAEPVNINTADASTLDRELKGIGATRAAAIVAYRTANGPFKNIDELALVNGIGQKVIDQNRAILVVDRTAKPANASSTAKSSTATKKPATTPTGQ